MTLQRAVGLSPHKNDLASNNLKQVQEAIRRRPKAPFAIRTANGGKSMNSGNPYCDELGIDAPTVEDAAQSRDISSYGLLIAALLERGGPMTLREAARRIAAAGVDDEEAMLASLKRCRPGRPPLYRNGNQYALDPHDDEAGLWAFRLGLKPPRSLHRPNATPKVEQKPLPCSD
jgi:hypothetical protein